MNSNHLGRQSLIERAQELAARHSEMGINPDNFFLFATSEIVGIIARLTRLHAEKIGGQDAKT